MVAIYVLKLERGKYYVGMTRKNIDRVLTHIDGRGAAWTKKYPPSGAKPILSFQEGLRESDEDRITLEIMKKYGVKNVRGGSWCMVRMTKREIADLEKQVRSHKKAPAKKKPKSKTSQGYCIRCRDRKKFEVRRPLCLDCYDVWAQYSNPDYIEDHCHKCGRGWDSSVDRPLCTSCRRKSKPKAKNKAKPKAKKTRCKGRTLYGTGPRCKLTVTSRSDYCRVHAPYYPKKRRRRRR